MAENKDMREREKIAREIEKTSESIRKKHRALKTGRIEEDIVTKRHFEPLIEPLQKIIDNSGVRAIKEEPIGNVSFTRKREKEEGEEYASKKKRSNVSFDISATPQKSNHLQISNDVPMITSTPRPTTVQPIESLENVFETTDDSLATIVRNQLQTSQGRKALQAQFGPLSQKYVVTVLSGNRESDVDIDNIYGVRLENNGMMLGNKHFDVDNEDNIIIDNVRYAGTPGLYELIFKKIPADDIYTDDDLQKYKSILFATNVHRRNYTKDSQLRSNRGYKYKHLIAPLMSIEPTPKTKKSGKGLPHAMTLNDNAIDYVHWDNPNELVDRLR
ncbi:uncharacterized protein LOC118646060 [Monomorium pharaonis]|uniref:uncharacterized protein LOC118646060 n=1 Tax=Monomorium pharaonis TaxID=307658 RepID=UPI00174623E2|nr:uncharacterized protein LOC118646060 [Monomorium pharaonis]